MRGWATLCALLLSAAATAAAQTEAGIEGGEIRVPRTPAATVGRAPQVIVFAAPVRSGEAAPTLAVEDVRSGGNVTVTFANPRLISSGTRYEWTMDATVANLPDADYEEVRVASASFGAAKVAFRYTLSNKPKVTGWSAASDLTKVHWPEKTGIPIVVKPTGGAGGALSIQKAALLDAATEKAITRDQLKICANATTACGTAPVSFPAGVGTPLYIGLIGDDIANGNYAGSIELALDGSSVQQTLTLAVSRSAVGVRVWGVGLIAIGVLLSMFVGVFARHASARATALLPAAQIAERAQRRLATVTQLKVDSQLPNLVQDLQTIITDMSSSALARYVGSWIPAPFGAADPAIAAAYATYLQEKSDRLEQLAYIVDHGVKPATDEWKQYPQTPATDAALAAALTAMDGFAADPTRSIQQLRTDVGSALTTLRNALAGAAGRAVAGPAAAPLPSSQQLLVMRDSVHLAVWLVWAVVTIVAGYAALILTNYGFGTGADLVKAFFWGLGMQMAGEQLQQLRPSSVTTALGIKLPPP